jgi:hypothetical protein
MALRDQLVGAPIESLTDLDAESAHDERIFVTTDEPLGGTRNSFCNFHIAIGDEKTSAANLITTAADSSIGGSILLSANQLKSLVGAQGLEPWTR